MMCCVAYAQLDRTLSIAGLHGAESLTIAPTARREIGNLLRQKPSATDGEITRHLSTRGFLLSQAQLDQLLSDPAVQAVRLLRKG